MIFHNFNTNTHNMFIVTPTDGVPIEHLKKIVDHYYKFVTKDVKEIFLKEPLIPMVPSVPPVPLVPSISAQCDT